MIAADAAMPAPMMRCISIVPPGLVALCLVVANCGGWLSIL